MDTIIIEVSGGVVQNVYGTQGNCCRVSVIDWDNSDCGQRVDVPLNQISLAPPTSDSKE
jgi:hypothetical protein